MGEMSPRRGDYGGKFKRIRGRIKRGSGGGGGKVIVPITDKT